MNGNNLGSRGEGWVFLQLVLFLLFILAPQVGPAWPASITFRIVGAVVLLGGFAVLTYSVFSLGRALTPFPRPLPNAELVTSGAYRFVRHPMYFGLLLALLGFSLLSLSALRLILTLLFAVFFDRKASSEERWLAERYPQYRAYQVGVKKLVPWLW